MHETIRHHQVTYDEYNALKAWLIDVGEDGEWPLFLDVWLEHVVEDVATDHRNGNKGSIEGPYYVPNAPELGANGHHTDARRRDRARRWCGTEPITSTDGTPLSGKVELWHADADGFYSQFAPGIPEWNLRGCFSTGPDGKFKITTIRPAPYQIPTDGSCGKLISAAGWHAWRPAHLHVKVSAPGHELLTAQLYFPGDPHNDDDIATAVKPELMLEPGHASDGSQTIATTSCSTQCGADRDMLFHVRMDVHIPADLAPADRDRNPRPGKVLLAGTTARRQVAAHLADRRRVRQLLDLRRRIQRRAPPAAFGATTVLLHGHSRHTAGPASHRHQGLTTHGALPQTRTSAVHSALTRPQCP